MGTAEDAASKDVLFFCCIPKTSKRLWNWLESVYGLQTPALAQMRLLMVIPLCSELNKLLPPSPFFNKSRNKVTYYNKSPNESRLSRRSPWRTGPTGGWCTACYFDNKQTRVCLLYKCSFYNVSMAFCILLITYWNRSCPIFKCQTQLIPYRWAHLQ